MEKLIIKGGNELSGGVNIQYSKNIAMKIILIPLIKEGVYTFKNIPKITSITNLIQLLELFNCKVAWTEENNLKVDSTKLKHDVTIPDEIFSHTSGAILAVQIISSRFGKCTFEKRDFSNIGGDNIGSRQLQITFDQVKNYGMDVEIKKNLITFIQKDRSGFNYTIPDSSYGISVGALFCALFKDTESKLENITQHTDFPIIIDILKSLGVEIDKKENDSTLYVNPINKIDTQRTIVDVADLHDFATLLSAGLCTESEITIKNFNYFAMAGELLEDYLNRLNVKYKIKNSDFILERNLIKELKPIDIVASMYPSFITEWQVLFSPLFARLPGRSSVVELWFNNRLSHWEELKKMGAIFNYLPNRQNRENKPFALQINGVENLKGSKVIANDLRCGGALVVAGLSAEGVTEITGVEHILRGYENLPERLNSLGADISIC